MPQVLVGDLNIAPREDDVWSHKQLLKIISHTPVETKGLNRIMAAGQWVDAIAGIHPRRPPLFWWAVSHTGLGRC